MNESDKPEQKKGLGVGIALGVAIGAGMGVAMDNIALGVGVGIAIGVALGVALRSEEHTSELQSLMRISYAVFCLKKKKKKLINNRQTKTQNERMTKQVETSRHNK